MQVPFASFLFFLFLSLSLQGQNYSALQLEIGAGVTNARSDEKANSADLSAELKLHSRRIELGVRYQRSFYSFGEDTPKEYSFVWNGVPDIGVGLHRRVLRQQSAYQVWLNYLVHYKEFKPIIGLGYSLFYVDAYQERYFNDRLQVTVRSIDARRYRSYGYRIGYRFQNYNYYILYYPNQRNVDESLFSIAMSYNIGLSKKENPPKSVLKVGNLDDDALMKFRLELGFSYVLPLQNQYNAMATDFYAGWMAFLHHNFYLGGSYESRGVNNGIDKRFIDVFEDEVNERLLTRTTAVANKISAIKFYLAKNLSREKPLDCFIGLGVGLYDIIDAGGYYSERGGVEINIRPVVEEQRNWGPFLRAGIRTGLFTNTLELNMPLGEIPVYINFKTGIGLNAFSTKAN